MNPEWGIFNAVILAIAILVLWVAMNWNPEDPEPVDTGEYRSYEL